MMAGEIFRLLAKGIHPETGELLPPASVVHTPDAIRLLFALAEEFSGVNFSSVKRQEKVKLTPEERREKNRAEGRPGNAYLPWSEEQKQELIALFRQGHSVSELAGLCERSPRSIAMQLEKQALITAEQAAAFS
ncbi:hypothetical protein ACMGEE_19195 [Erwinia sp. DT-104]|jgi:hypothetical protein|uniref:Uncharacterized protein n=1 Tax=Erwinia plantamica TaxID=3237104 RepID=A0ABW7CS38_9GAMM|nr:hypothetical protein [Erwinia sp. BC051422]MDN8543763.1 hypothetical protein [Erwinia sp. BC051422]